MSSATDWLFLVEREGLVVSEPVLQEHFSAGLHSLTKSQRYWFRREAERFLVASRADDGAKREQGAKRWIDHLLEQVLEQPAGHWLKAGQVPESCRCFLQEFDQELKADRVLMHDGKPRLLVNIVSPDQDLDRKEKTPGRWKASPATRTERLLRESGVALGLVTNGEFFRLLYAPAGLNGGQLTWSTRLLVEEKAALDAFISLLGPDCLTPEDQDSLHLADLCRLSQDRQMEVADQLGQQVRDGLERLLWAWDEADRACQGELLSEMDEAALYEMGLVIMMRFVFLLYAEERHLLPHGEVLYDKAYGLTWLWHRLLGQKREEEARMEQSFDAWDRFLATCRLVHGGCRHPDLNLMAYGGSLFDPQRFSVLESPDMRVSNKVFYEVLYRLLFARQRKGGEPQRVGYWAVDVEQIGYVYEGLLDHRCARAGQVPVVKLRGAGEAAMEVSELEGRDPEELSSWIAKQTKRKKERIAEELQAEETDPKDLACLQRFPPAVVERVLPFAGVIQCDEVVPPGWRYLTMGTSRRASGAHYTPQSLTERIVRKTLEPLVYKCEEGKPGKYLEPRQIKSPRELLGLKICDIAMGSGAFLVQAVRYLGDRLQEAWDQALAEHDNGNGPGLAMPYAEKLRDPAGERLLDADRRDEMELWARRYVAERCIYGVDVNPLAVEMSKLSLWLTTLAKDRPFTFLDHALRCGDSLVGVDDEQLRTWSLDRSGDAMPLLRGIVEKPLKDAMQIREDLQSISVIDVEDAARKRALLRKADEALATVRLAGDLLMAPSFAEEKAQKRNKLRQQLHMRFMGTGRDDAALREQADELLAGQPTFHWVFEFPEVFLENERGGFDAIIGNPPFIGGQFVRRQLGDAWPGFLRERWPQSHGTADLVAFFFLRAHELLREGGNFGLIATNTISQGDTRESGLDYLVEQGASIYTATPRMPWPGLANVNVSVVHLCKGKWQGDKELDQGRVEFISSSLDQNQFIGKPHRLKGNQGKSFIGSYVLGMGFIMTPEEAHALIEKNPKNKDVLFPYLNGKDLNTSPAQEPSRWVINFFDWPIEKAMEYPDCFEIVKEKVKPERDQNNRKNRREKWWQYGEVAPNLYRAIDSLPRVLLTTIVTKHLVFSFSNPKQVFAHKLCVFPSESSAMFALLQSSFHQAWAWSLSSTMRLDLNYSPSDCFETFPIPPENAEQTARLRDIGAAYEDHRQKVMAEAHEGLTKTYNRFHDPSCSNPGIQKLRDLQVDMDNGVKDAYGWGSLNLEHGWVESTSTEEKKDRKTGKVKTVERKAVRFSISEGAKTLVLSQLMKLNNARHRSK